MRTLLVGVVRRDGGATLHLADAASREPGLDARAVDVDEPRSDGLDGLILDVPLDQRAALLGQLAARWRVPILVESPIGADPQQVEAVASLTPDDTAIVAANPLRFGPHTRRLLDELARGNDPLQMFFAAWRFRPQAFNGQALPRLLDFLRALCPDEATRVSAMQASDRSILTVTLRYASDVLGTIEVGSHLPATFPSPSELILECFCRERTYLCMPGNQAVTVFGREPGAYDWQPDPADLIVRSFAAWLRGGPRPPGDVPSDLSALRLCEGISHAAARVSSELSLGSTRTSG